MGRELRRKQAKKDGKPLNLEKNNKDPYSDIYKLLKTFIILLLVVIGIHFFTALVITKEIDWFSKEEKEENITSVKNSILAKSIFKQTEEEYYVYFYDFDEEDSNISSLINSKLSENTIYKVNTNDGLNSNYITDNEVGNSNAKTLEELQIINPTLIKISGDTISKYLETSENIKEYLNSK